MNKYILSFVLLPLIAAFGVVSEPRSIDSILDSDHRLEQDKQRDIYRHPKETLAFFGLKPNHTVLDIWPGSGWYTEIVAPYVKGSGQYIAANFSPERFNSGDKREVYWGKISLKFMEKVAEKDIYGDVQLEVFENGKFEKPNNLPKVDIVLLIRSIHIWDEQGTLSEGLKSVFEVLKPGGILGIVQHRSNSISSIASSASEGYMDELYVIDAVTQAGFELEASSNINANPNDTKDYPRGVYTLPPTLAMGNVERDKYLQIGESDRMTLKFVKPTHAKN
ncbi:methyltransferase [Psychrosphaera sp. B3R10]|uniref:class I SAM-dependent methyltransferase n=1 Tax=unclassified Psychrosphaera TaxID=2641570 RepID=UPI001C0A04F0|nr:MULTISPECIES: methyltransferase [unclassified Psychrosphaera]MBU2883832.1 methyltransferase [Psychrosphaera sp. I2R16]MBU2989658.1 methyltransferase [Psychrosphaera sp. B3R10]